MQPAFAGLEAVHYQPSDPGTVWEKDPGIVLDLALLRFGIGAGPNLGFELENTDDVFDFGANIKVNGEILLGGISINISYLMFINDFTLESVDFLANNLEGMFGISVLFKVF